MRSANGAGCGRETVNLNRLTESVGFLTIQEMPRVDEALALVLDL